jgi:formylglycine-generating enzyme required for sulfatase activity
VQVFLKRLNDRDHDHTYRLPTEAEWEYACTDTAPAAASPRLEEVAWFAANAEDKTQPVGTKRPNSRGIFDMLGNVAEWVQDWYERDYYYQSPATDPQGPDAGSYRVYRGGCWFDEARNCRCPYRGFDFPSNRVYNVGFRVVRTNRA